MSSTPPVSDLLFRWDEARRQGSPVTPEELCRDCPDWLDELKRQIQVLELIRPHLAGEEPDTTADTSPAPSAAALTPPSGAAGRYRAVRAHAQGGLGEVLVAEDEELNRPVALKRIQDRFANDPAYRRRFLREAEITGRLQHPGIVPVYGLTWDDGGRPCYAMRFIEGQTLGDALDRFHAQAQPLQRLGFGGVEFRQLLQRFVAVCNAVAYAHSRGILHRDIKPANIMLGRYGETLVVDWGLARPVGRSDADRSSGEETLTPSSGLGTEATEVGSVVGTPAFMSPEQAAGALDELGPAADIFSLGATLYEVLTGQVPYPGGKAVALGNARRWEFTPPRRVKAEVPPALEAVCLRAMTRRPEDRYPTALELAAEVERWLADEPIRAYRDPWPERVRRWGRRHRPLVAGAAALLLMAVVLLVVLYVQGERARRAIEQEQSQTAAERDTARTERAGAVDARNRTREAFDTMTSQVTTDWLATQKELLPRQREFLENALKYYQEFAREAPTDEAGRKMVADAHHRVGLMFRHLGQYREAAAALREAIELHQRLAAEARAVPEHRKNLAVNLSNLGSVLGVLGQADEEEAAHRRAAELSEQLVAEHPAVAEYRMNLAGALSNLGVALQSRRKAAEAEDVHRRAIRLREGLVKDFPNDPRHRNDLAYSQTNLGAVLNQSGRDAEQEAAYVRAIELWDPLVVGRQAPPEYRRGLAFCLDNLGLVLQQPGRRAQSDAAFRRAIELREQLAAEYPAVPQYRQNLARSLINRGLLLQSMDRVAEVETLYRRAVELSEQLVKDHGGVAEYRKDLSTYLNSLGILLKMLGKDEESQKACRQSVELRMQLITDFPSESEHVIELGRICCTLGLLDRMSGKNSRALDWYEVAARALEPVREKHPEWNDVRLMLVSVLEARADAYVVHGRPADALRDLDRAVTLGDPPQRAGLRLYRARVLARAGQPEQAVAEADTLAGGTDASGQVLYDAARVYAQASATAPTDSQQAGRYAARAVELLRRAVTRGYARFSQFLEDGNLHPLRGRADFADLLWDVADLPQRVQ